VLLANFQQSALPKALDILVLGIAVAGILLIKIPAVRWFLLLGVVLQIGMAAGVHILVRYGVFLSTCSLIGLAVFFESGWHALRNQSSNPN
jgi:hypothetical protein